MASFPTLATGQVAMYGTQRGRRYATEVAQFCDDSEQRWPVAQGTATFTLNLVDLDGYEDLLVVTGHFYDLDGYEVSNVEEFFRSMKGRYDTTWDVTVGGTLYSNMMFDQDEIAWTFTKPMLASAQIRCRQWRPN